MNTRWFKQNLMVIIFVAVFAGMLGGIVWMEQKATARKAEVDGNLSAQKSELDRLVGLAVYPSPDNFQSRKRDRDQLQKLYQSLQEAVSQSRLGPSNVANEIEFVSRLVATQAELRDLAKSHRVDMRDDFAFGFSRYRDIFPCRNPPLKPDDCKKVLAWLSKELLVIDRLTRMAVSNGVDAITVIHRPEVEPGVSASPDTFAAPISDDPKARFQKLPFDLQVNCGEVALKAFLNSLAQSDWFFTVESLRLLPESALSEPAMHAAASFAVDAPGSMGTVGAQQKRLTATMRINLVEFPAKAETNQVRNRPR